jgi:hypothetical protein
MERFEVVHEGSVIGRPRLPKTKPLCAIVGEGFFSARADVGEGIRPPPYKNMSICLSMSQRKRGVEVVGMKSGDLHTLGTLVRLMKDNQAVGNAAIDAVGSSGDKEAGVSRHGIPPARRRENQILPGPPTNQRLWTCARGARAAPGTHGTYGARPAICVPL